MKRYAVVTSSLKDATSFYRVHMAFASHRDVELVFFGDDISESEIYHFDCIYLQRPFEHRHKKILETARRWNIKTWVDFDDLLTKIPFSNPASHIYLGLVDSILKIIDLADIVTVSTPGLRDVFGQRCSVIHNALPFDPPEVPNTNKVVMWRGGSAHVRDVTMIGPVCLALAEKYPDWLWVFCGDLPWWASFLPKNCHWEMPQDVGDFLDSMCRLMPRVLLCPLEDHLFNRCKSNIAWLEATRAGAVCLSSKFDEFEFAEHFGKEDFQGRLESLMTDDAHLEHAFLRAVAGLPKYSFEEATRKRREIIDSIPKHKLLLRAPVFQSPEEAGQLAEIDPKKQVRSQ